MIKWIIKETKEIFKGRMFTLHDRTCYHKEMDFTHDFFIIDTSDWINVVALTTDNKFIIVKQHRLGTDTITLETPGGLIEKDESPELTARRELKEETGYEPENVILMKKLATNPAIMNNYIYFYAATNCIKVSDQNLDKAEDIEVLTLSRDEVDNLIFDGTIDHSIVITALLLYFNLNQKM